MLSTRSFRALAATLAAVSLSAACTAHAPSEPVKPAAPTPTPIERGRYLATVAACGDCHTPFKMGANGPEPDMSRMLSGHPETLSVTSAPALAPPFVWAGTATNTAFAGPWGISFAMNLTPDVDTGLGSWNDEMFVKALRTGKHMGDIAPDSAADAVVVVQPDERRRFEGALRLLAKCAGDQESTAGLPAARCATRGGEVVLLL